MRQRRRTFRPGGEIVEIDGHLVSSEVEFKFEGNDDEPDVRARVHIQDGRPYLHTFAIEARDARSQITDADLRIATSDRAEDWIAWLMGHMPGAMKVNPDGTTEGLPLAATSYTELRFLTHRARNRARAVDLREHLAHVAEVYRNGGAKGAQAVADEFDIKLRTAQLWVKQARDAELLGPALRGKAGEA